MVLLLAAAFVLGWVPVAATAEPSRWESFLGHRALAASLARQAPRLQNPIALTNVNLQLGLKIYRDNCSGCHGDAKPSLWGTTAFYPRVPQFGSDPPIKPDWQMFWIVKRGVRYTGMGAWERLMSDDDTWKVIAFLSHLKQLPPDVETEWRGQPLTK
jgi:mono/diheme cytochrome c family protein